MITHYLAKAESQFVTADLPLSFNDLCNLNHGRSWAYFILRVNVQERNRSIYQTESRQETREHLNNKISSRGNNRQMLPQNRIKDVSQPYLIPAIQSFLQSHLVISVSLITVWYLPFKSERSWGFVSHMSHIMGSWLGYLAPDFIFGEI